MSSPDDQSDGSSQNRFREEEQPHASKRSVRMVGSITDPGVDDDGLGLSGPGAPVHDSESHPVRARLLEKARLAQEATFDEPTGETTAENFSEPAEQVAAPALPTPAPSAVASELERIARRSPVEQEGPSLSPNMIALLGGLIGLTVISTLGLFLGKAKGDVVLPVEKVALVAAPAEEKEEPALNLPKREKVPGPWRIDDDKDKPGHKIYSGKIGKNAFLTAIQSAGLSKNEAYRAYSALKDLKDLDHCKSGDSFQALVRLPEKTLIAFEYIVTKEEVYQAKENQDGRMAGAKLDLKVIRNQVRRSFLHDGKSFEESALRSGFDPGISSIAEAALRGHASLSDFKKGDRLRIIAQEVTVLGEFSRYSGVEAMEIVRPGEDPRRIYYFSHAIEGGHFDVTGKAPYEGGWRKPIPGAPVTSKFNPNRMHPVLNKVMPHNGTDFGAPSGTPIGATAPGVVTFIGMAGRSGNLVKVRHDGGYESGYAHLSRFVSGLKIGDKVDRMQTVGYCGTTGSSTGPHLHFSMKKDDRFIDAESLNLDGLRVLPKAYREEFAAVRSKYDPILDAIPLPAPLPVGEEAVAQTAEVATDSEDEMGPDPEEGVADPEQLDEASITSAPSSPAKAKGTAPAANVKAPDTKPATPAQTTEPSSIFLSDADLLRMQSRTDAGEVKE